MKGMIKKVIFKGEECKVLCVTEQPNNFSLKMNDNTTTIKSVTISLPNGRILEDVPFERVEVIE